MITEIKLYSNFTFSTACQNLKICDKELHIIATGTYPPSYKVFIVYNGSEILEKRLTAEIVDFCYVDGSSKKMAFMRNDKHIELHFKYNMHHRIKMSDFRRHVKRFSYNVYYKMSHTLEKIDLKKGIIGRVCQVESEINNFCISKVHGLIALFTNNGIIFYDGRTDELVCRIKSGSWVAGDFDHKLMLSAAYVDKICTFDIRNFLPVLDVPLRNVIQVKYYKNKLYVANEKGINMFEYLNKIDEIEISRLDVFDIKDSILFVGCNDQVVKTFYTGYEIVPKWCSYTGEFKI